MKRLLLLIAILLFCTTTLSVAGKIYKWTDSEGNIHYGERPPSGQQGKQVHVPKGPAYTAKPAAKAGNPADARKNLLDAFDKERKEKAEATAKSEKEKAARDKNCSNARKRVAGLSIGGRIYDITEQGERKYLEDAEIKKRLAEANKAVEKWCN
jgi:hypothetical protein